MHANSMDRILENSGSLLGSASIRVHSRSFAVPHLSSYDFSRPSSLCYLRWLMFNVFRTCQPDQNLKLSPLKPLKILPSLLALFASSAQAAVTLTTLHSFTGPDGANPVGLLQGRDGIFYGTTEFGGTGAGKGNGTILKMLPDGTLTTLHSFAGDDDGRWPEAGLVQGPDGTLYGTTTWGGLLDLGTMFAITPAG